MGRRGFDPLEIAERLARGELGPCGDGRFSIDRHGTWFYEGSPIARPELVRLFARVLHRLPDGRHFLITPFERIEVEVEDAPFLAVDVREETGEAGPRLVFRTNVGEEVVLSPRHPLRPVPDGRGGAVPYLGLERGLEARVTRAVFYELVDRALPGADGRFGVISEGTWFPLEPEPR